MVYPLNHNRMLKVIVVKFCDNKFDVFTMLNYSRSYHSLKDIPHANILRISKENVDIQNALFRSFIFWICGLSFPFSTSLSITFSISYYSLTSTKIKLRRLKNGTIYDFIEKK